MGSLFDNLKSAFQPPPASTRPAVVEVAGDRDFGSEQYAPTRGQTFDTGQGPENPHDSGGFRDTADAMVIANSDPLVDEDLGKAHKVHMRYWTGEPFVLAANGPPQVITPSGIDARKITCVTLLASESGCRFGPDLNSSRVGPRLPASRVWQIYTGPVWITPGAVAVTVDVTVEWEDIVEHPAGGKCGCQK